MDAALIVAVGIAIAVIIWFAKRKIVIVDAKAKIAEIPAVYERLQGAGKEGCFAAFMFAPHGKSSPEESINLQFSIEGGRVGFDWVLLGSANIQDKEKFVQFASTRGYRVVQREMNKVHYLRVEEGGSLPKLCEMVIRELYSMPADSVLDLIPEGFRWP